MSLLRRIELALIVILGGLMATSVLAYYLIVDRNFSILERDFENAEIASIHHALESELDRFSFLVEDFSSWDDTYAFIQAFDQEYVDYNFDAENLNFYDFDILLYLTIDNQPHFQSVGLDSSMDSKLPERLSNAHWREQNLLTSERILGEDGLITTPQGALLLVTRPILKSDDTGPIRGYLVAGRYIDENIERRLEVASGKTLTLGVSGGTRKKPTAQVVRHSSTSQHLLTIPTIDNDKSLSVEFDSPRNISFQNNITFVTFTVVILVAVLATLILMRVFLATSVVRVLARLGRSFSEIGEEENLPPSVNLSRRDEIGDLAREFDGMLERLKHYRNIANEANQRIQQNYLDAQRAESLALLGSYVWHVPDDYMLNCSEEFAHLHNRSIEETLNAFASSAMYHQQIIPDDLGPYLEAERNAKQQKQPFTAEYRCETENGIKHFREVCEFEFDGLGNAILKRATCQDVTEVALLQEQLRHDEKLKAIGQLAAGVAHDFNNLLVIIMGNIDLTLNYSTLNEKQSDRLATALAAADRGAKLVEKLLSYAQKQPLQIQEIEVYSRLQEMSGLLKDVLGSSIGITLPDQGIWHTRADPAQLESALLNIAINARDAMPAGGTLSFRVDETADPEDKDSGLSFICISVSDTGTGMTPDVLERAADPFFTTKGVGKGSGLGLSMVYGFARQSLGKMEIDSAPGTGTTVKLFLPNVGQPSRSTATVDDRSEADADLTVLIVEDEPDVMELVATLLNALGYETESAFNVSQALDILNSATSVDLILSDIVLPGELSGVDLAGIVESEFPDIPLVLTSGHPGESKVASSHNFLKKPYGINELKQCLESAVTS